MSLTRLCVIGLLAGFWAAVALISTHALLAYFWPNESLHEAIPDFLAEIFVLFLLGAHYIETNIDWRSIDTWIAFGNLILANSVIYSVAVPVAYFVNDYFERKFKKLKLFFSKAKEARCNLTNKPLQRHVGDGLVWVSALGFTVGLSIAIAITVIIGVVVSIHPHYMMESHLDDIVIFVYPAHFAVSAITKMNFSAFIFIFVLILINGARYFILFFLLGVVWRFIFRHLGWPQARKIQ